MSTIVTRAGKGSALTYAEVDSNFTNLNTDKYQSGSTASLASLTLSSALPAPSGGTGQSSYAVGDLLYASTTTALSKLADVATGNALISGGVGVAPAWGKIGLTTHVSGTLPVANGGTGITSLGAGIATWLGTPSSANLLAAMTDETGTGSLVFGTSPTLVTPTLGAASATSVAFGLGAAATPSITFTGDLNTGVWSPAADTLAASTAGLERLRITSAGDTFLNTTGYTIGTAAGTVIPRLGAVGPIISIRASAGGGEARYHLYNVGSTAEWLMGQKSGTAHNFVLSKMASGVELDHVVVQPAGHVGISTTPSAWVASVRAIQIGVGGSVSTWDGSNGSVTLGANLYDAGSAVIRYINSAAAGAFDIGAGAFTWRTAPAGIAGDPITFTQAMTLTSAGSLGIGTASPASKLEVSGGNIWNTNTATPGIALRVTDVSSNGANLTSDSSGNILFTTRVTAVNTERMRITSAGNVGIGTSAPSYKLQTQGAVAAVSTAILTGTNNDIKLLLNNDATNNSVAGHLGMIAWVGHNRSVASNLSAYISAYKDTGQFDDTANLVFATSDAATMPVERMRITRSGSVGIGTTTPADMLEIAAGGTLRLTTTNWNAGAIRFFSNLAGALNYDYMIQRGGDATFKDYLVAHIPGNADPGRFGVISSGGNVRFVVEGNTGKVGIGTTTNLSTLTVNGSFASKSPSTVNAATYTVAATDGSLRFTTTNCTVTLPAPASFPGRILYLNTITANSVISASANVIPLGSNTAGTAILAATLGKFAMLQSDGTNWITMMSN